MESVLATTTAAATTTTVTTATVISVLWTFDSTTNDTSGSYNGALVNGAGYSAVSQSQPYIGNGRALWLNNSVSVPVNQSFTVSQFINLASLSFTLEAWIYASSYAGDNPILSQCQCVSCSGQCLSFIVRGARLYVGFNLNDLQGVASLVVNTWYHVAFVYNMATSQQILYLNGVQDAIKSSAAAYQGQSGSIVIGAAQTLTQTNFFIGYIDHVRVTTRAKSATEILNSATLMAYYSFDLPNQNVDSGPNGLTGVSNNVALDSGRVNQAIRFSGTNSFFQAYGFYQLAWGVLGNRAFTIAMWVNPASIASSTIVQVSPFQNSSLGPAYIMNLMGFWSSGGTTRGQFVTQVYAWPCIFGPFLPLNTWSHVAFTFSPTNGNTQYYNGAVVGTTGAAGFSNVYGTIMWLQIGYSFCWNSAYIPCAGYQGAVDELYAYNRELSASEIYALANP